MGWRSPRLPNYSVEVRNWNAANPVVNGSSAPTRLLGRHVWCGGMQFPLFLFEVSFRCILRLPSQLPSTQRRKRGIALQFISQGKHAFSHDSSRPTRRQENQFTRTVSDITWFAPLLNYQVLVSVRVVLDNGGATAGLRAVSRDGITGVSPGIGDTKRK